MKIRFPTDTELMDVEGEKRGKGNASCVISRIRDGASDLSFSSASYQRHCDWLREWGKIDVIGAVVAPT